jgi:hypothetical protein
MTERLPAFVISALAVLGGICGLVWPEIFRSSMQETYTSRSARLGSIVLLLMGFAGLYATLAYHGGPIDFFPA